MNEPEAKQITPRDGLSFIHSSLDDAGLLPAEFRVYCHVARRAGREGVCNGSLASIASHCGYCEDITRDALRLLTVMNMLRRNYIAGLGCEYRLNPPRLWKLDARSLPTGRKNSEGTPPKNYHHHPSEKLLPKGIPIQGSPKKVLEDASMMGDGNGLKALMKTLTEQVTPSAINAPTLAEVQAFLRSLWPGAESAAKPFFTTMTNQGWRDKQKRPIDDWRKPARSYANTCERNHRGVTPTRRHR